MKTLHRYLTGQVLASLILTAMVFTSVLLLANVLKEILPLLISGQVGLGVVLHAIGLLVPFVLVYALPMGLLTSTLLVFGRFSADQEFTAARASGISLLSLLTPILLLSLALCGASALVNLYFGPMSRVAYNALRVQMGSQLLGSILPEGQSIKDIPGFIFRVGKNDGTNLTNVKFWRVEPEGATTIGLAPRGSFQFTATNGLELHLYDVTTMVRQRGVWTPGWTAGDVPIRTNLPTGSTGPQGVRISDMTLPQLQAELRERNRLNFVTPTGNLSPNELREQMRFLRNERQDFSMPVLVQMNWRISFSFACFGFTLVGIPLGIRIHRRETNVGILVALGLVLVYYSFIFLGQSLSNRPDWLPHLIVWVPNFIFQVIGGVLLWRANKGI